MLLKGNELAIQNTRFLKKNVYAPEGWMLWKFSRTPKMDSDECMNWWKNMFWKHSVDLNRKNESWPLVSHEHKNLMLECPHGCMHDQFYIKFLNHHCCMCVIEINVGHPFVPEPLAKPTPWHTSCPTVPQAFWPKTSNHHKPWPRMRISILVLRRRNNGVSQEKKSHSLLSC